MREIKFRAWTGDRMVNPACVGEYGEWYRTGLDYENGRGDKEDLMQFTGLKDKNGKEIYEGDIVQLSNPFNQVQKAVLRGVIEFNLSCYSITGIQKIVWEHYTYGLEPSDIIYLNCIAGHKFEVIGNIYENSELLNS